MKISRYVTTLWHILRFSSNFVFWEIGFLKSIENSTANCNSKLKCKSSLQLEFGFTNYLWHQMQGAVALPDQDVLVQWYLCRVKPKKQRTCNILFILPNSILVFMIVCLVSLAKLEVMGVVVSLPNLSQPDEGNSWKSFTVLIWFGVKWSKNSSGKD